MKSLQNRLAKYPLIITLVSGFWVMDAHAEFDVPEQCPAPEYQAKTHDIAVTGVGVTRHQSQLNASAELALHRANASIQNATRLIQQTEKVSVDDVTHINVHHEMTQLLHFVSTKRCRKGYVTYLAFDPRSLAQRIKDMFGTDTFKDRSDWLSLPSLLTEKSTARVWLDIDSTQDGQWELVSKNKRMSLTQAEWADIFELPDDSPALKMKVQKHRQLKAVQQISMTLPQSGDEFTVYVCSNKSRCQLLGHSYQPGETVEMVQHAHPDYGFVLVVDTQKYASKTRRLANTLSMEGQIGVPHLNVYLRHVNNGVYVQRLATQ